MKNIIKTSVLSIILVFISASTIAQNKGYKVGDEATNFTLENIDGKKTSLSDYKDAKGFIIVFTCNTCPYSVAYEDRIMALDKKYKTKGYPVIAINPNDPAAKSGDSMAAMKVRAKEKGFTFPYLLDVGQKIYPQYGASRTPHVYILERQGNKYIVQYIGAIDNSSRNPDAVTERYAEDALDALLAGQQPTTTYTRAIGCSIKTL
ncbi:MAG: thioredoxin family protein [Flavobacteriales bacterium]|nr:thioredoxin family protein [Flavobacteriales bacterium]